MQGKSALVGALIALASAGVPLWAAGNGETHDASTLPLSNVIGKAVTNAEGEALGKVTDLILDLREGWVRYAILEFGGIAGLDEKLFAYPLGAFRVGKADNELLLNVDRSQLAGAEGFERDRFPPGNDPYWARAERAQGRTASASAGAGLPPGAITPPEFVRASRVLGCEIHDTRGDDDAQVKDLLVDLRSGRIQQVVLENDGRTVKLPMQRISAAGSEDELRLKADVPSQRER